MKYLSLILLVFFGLVGFSNAETSLSLSPVNLPDNIYGLIEKKGETYVISSFVYELNGTQRGKSWIHLNSNVPTWDIQSKRRCGRGLLKDRNQNDKTPSCDEVSRPNFFMDEFMDKGDMAVRVLAAPLFAGVTLTGASYEVRFNRPRYEDALAQAYKNSIPQNSADFGRQITENLAQIARVQQEALEKTGSKRLVSQQIPSVSSVQAASLEDLAKSLNKMVQDYASMAEKLYAQRLADYRSSFASARTAADFNYFIEEFKRFDPDGVLDAAKAKREVARARELAEAERQAVVERERQEEAERLARVEQLRREKVEQKERAALKASISKFRNTVKSGDNSNCGLVIEVRRAVVNVQSMIGPTFIKLSQLYPEGFGCRFVNGVYEPPDSL